MPTLRRSLVVALLAAVVLPHRDTAAQGARFDTVAAKGIVRLADPQLAPDGATVALLVTRADYEANSFRTTLVTVRVADGAQVVRVTERGVGQPRWSPQGDRLAFLATVDGVRQVHVMPAAGGAETVVTRSPTDVQSFAWRPDGGAIAYIAAEERRRAPMPGNVGASFEVGNDDYRVTAPPVASQLWTTPSTGGAPTRLTQGPGSLATPIALSSISWSADGRTIAVTRYPSPSSGDGNDGVITLVSTADGTARPLTGRTLENGAHFSPDGRRLAFSTPRDGDPANVDEIVTRLVNGGIDASATRAIDRQVTLAGWRDSATLVVTGVDGTRGALWALPLGAPPRRLPLGALASVSGVSITRQAMIALVGTEPGRPAELYVKSSDDALPRRLTDFNGRIATLALGRSERLTWRTHDGMTADGVVTYPPGWTAGARRPLVLLVHGGPTASSTEAFSPLAQLLAARGWVVFQPNYRGSDNLGNAFQRAIANDAGEGPGRDVMAGVDTLIGRGVADPQRLAVTGWSYGGFMTAWLIGRYPDRWRAAMAGAAPVDLTDMYALTDNNVMRRHAITASPFVGDNYAKAMAQSPIVHLAKARTPTLIMSMTGDVRVVITGSYKILHALRDNGVPAQFVAFPGSGHGPPDPVRQLERDVRWVEWVARYLEGPAQ